MKAAQPRQACILVGGKGTRLGPITQTIPKPLIKISGNVCLLDIVIDNVVRQGFYDVVLLAGHLGHIVRERYHERTFGPAHTRVFEEPKPLGTAGALAAARGVIAPRFLLLNGDTLFDIDLNVLWNDAADGDREALIALRHVADSSRYGSVIIDGKRIVRFVEKTGGAAPGLISGGVYVLRSSVINRIHAVPCSLESDVFPMLAREHLLHGNVVEGYFIDVGLPETLQLARVELSARANTALNFMK